MFLAFQLVNIFHLMDDWHKSLLRVVYVRLIGVPRIVKMLIDTS